MNTKTFSKYYTHVTLIVGALLFFAICMRVSYIQFIEGDKWREQTRKIEKKQYPVEAQRGNIYSHDGRLLVTTVPSYYLRFDYKAAMLTRWL